MCIRDRLRDSSRKFHSCPRSFASWPTVRLFELSFSLGYYPSIQQRTGKGFIYFITFRIISQSERTMIVPEHFVNFFVFLSAELSTSISFLCHKFLQKVFFCFAWPIKSLAWTLSRARFVAFFSVETKSDDWYQIGWRISLFFLILNHVDSFIQWESKEIVRWVIGIDILNRTSLQTNRDTHQ